MTLFSALDPCRYRPLPSGLSGLKSDHERWMEMWAMLPGNALTIPRCDLGLQKVELGSVGVSKSRDL